MSQTLSGAVDALRHAGATLSEAGARMGALDPGARAFGGDATGALGELGRGLHLVWQRGLDARAREAAAHGARVTDAADALAAIAAAYADVDDTARRQHGGVSS
jgi:hypothetical protein